MNFTSPLGSVLILSEDNDELLFLFSNIPTISRPVDDYLDFLYDYTGDIHGFRLSDISHFTKNDISSRKTLSLLQIVNLMCSRALEHDKEKYGMVQRIIKSNSIEIPI